MQLREQAVSPSFTGPPDRIDGIQGIDRINLVAIWVSRLASPPCLGVLAVGLVASAAGGVDRAWTWALAYLCLVLCVPAGYVLVQHRRGAISDLDLSVRHERLRPYCVTIAVLFAAAGMMHLGGSPRLLGLLADAVAMVILLLGAITWRWKISAHAAVAAMLAVLVAAVQPPLAPYTAILVPLVCWSRIHLRRHDLAQTLAGSLVGGGVLAIVLIT